MAVNNFVGVGKHVRSLNVSVVRLLGRDLVAQAKIPDWIFYIEEIQCCAIYANDGTERWYGMDGKPVAGNIATRNSIIPHEGQRYYVIEEDKNYEYKGGSWTGTTYSNVLSSPTAVTKSASGQLSVGVSYIISGDGNYVLPTTGVATGHEVWITVAADVEANLKADTGSDIVLQGNAVSNDYFKLETGILYYAVFLDGYWNIFFSNLEGFSLNSENLSELTNKETARSNINVLSVEESEELTAEMIDAIGVTAPVKKSGSASSANLMISVTLADATTAEDLTNNKVLLTPYTGSLLVNRANKMNQHNNITGLVDYGAKFTITYDAPTGTISYNAFQAAFNLDPYMRSNALQLVTFNSGQKTIPSVPEVVTYYVVAKIDGTVSINLTKPLSSSVNEVLLAIFVAKDGALITGTNLLVAPWLASTDYGTRNKRVELRDISANIADSIGHISVSSYSAYMEGINWKSSTIQPHNVIRIGQNNITWGIIDSTDDSLVASNLSQVSGSTLDDGSAVTADQFTIQILLWHPVGHYFVLRGQQEYATMADALADLYTYAPSVGTFLNNAEEVARWIICEDQYSGNGAFDTGNPNKFRIFSGTGVAVTSSNSTAATISSSTDNNSLGSTNLQVQIDELSSRTSWVELTTETVAVSNQYLVKWTGNKVLPSAAIVGKTIRFKVSSDNLAATVSAALIKRGDDLTKADTDMAFDVTGIYTFIARGTYWEVHYA